MSTLNLKSTIFISTLLKFILINNEKSVLSHKLEFKFNHWQILTLDFQKKH